MMSITTAHVRLMVEFLTKRAQGMAEEERTGYLAALEDLSGLINAQIERELDHFMIDVFREESQKWSKI